MRSPNSRVRCKLISFLIKRQSWLISYIFVSELLKKITWSFSKQKCSTNIKKKTLKKRIPTKICSFVSTYSAQYRRQVHDEIAMAPFNQNKHILHKTNIPDKIMNMKKIVMITWINDRYNIQHWAQTQNGDKQCEKHNAENRTQKTRKD
jgi:hypothetical protein